MNFWIYKKKKYLSNLNKIKKENDFFFFWNGRTTNTKDFLINLESLNISSVWLKGKTYTSLYLKNNPKLNSILKSQCFLSYGTLSEINLNSFVDTINKNKQKIVFLGLLLDNKLFLDLNRFNLVKPNLNLKDNRLNFLRKIFIYFTLNRILWLKFLYLLNFKKNFSLIK